MNPGQISLLLIWDMIEPQHEIFNNVVCATIKASDKPAKSDQSLC